MYCNRALFWKFHVGLIEFHKKYAEEPILYDQNKLLILCNKIFGIGTTFCIISGILYPIFDSIFLSKKKVLAFGYLFPFVDPEGKIGFWLNYLFQNIVLIIVGSGFGIFLRMYFLFFAHACMRSDILKNTVESLKEHISDITDEKQNLQLTLKLDEIVELHIEYLSFIDILETVGKKIIFLLALGTIIEVSLLLLILATQVINTENTFLL